MLCLLVMPLRIPVAEIFDRNDQRRCGGGHRVRRLTVVFILYNCVLQTLVTNARYKRLGQMNAAHECWAHIV